ncbi:trypsin-like peptidase domain-containing protein [Ferruginibacter yonginensis]|uniref:Trypsin-like peptidase domain-containing protein n=1 Tax=Ferruginibacter yonginensis TaxID=1310416 RepID=A0ABV8QSY8_9BACT
MFEYAIATASNYTRPINTIIRTYGGKQITTGSSTLFFINDEAVAITCKHVAQMLASSDHINKTFNDFKKERAALPNDGKYKMRLKGLEIKYNYDADTIIQMKNTFVDCVDSMQGFTTHVHPTADLAIIQFKGFGKKLYNNHAIFLKDSGQIKQGNMLCRLGFPFPEFTNFTFNEAADDIDWSHTGVASTPQFPIDGMVTRFLADSPNEITGIEMSTPGLKGQSGGPLFNKDGIVYGMQFSTKHLHLGFDLVNKDIIINHQHKKVTDYSFLHLGQCVHVDVIKSFLKQHHYTYFEN